MGRGLAPGMQTGFHMWAGGNEDGASEGGSTSTGSYSSTVERGSGVVTEQSGGAGDGEVEARLSAALGKGENDKQTEVNTKPNHSAYASSHVEEHANINVTKVEGEDD